MAQRTREPKIDQFDLVTLSYELSGQELDSGQ